jgi:hypothetical protein
VLMNGVVITSKLVSYSRLTMKLLPGPRSL